MIWQIAVVLSSLLLISQLANASPLQRVRRQAEEATTTQASSTTTVSPYAWADIPIIEDQPHLVISLGPTGGNARGYSAIRGAANHSDTSLVFYVNGLLSPDIHLVRNVTYYIFPLTGIDYPVYLTEDAVGGFAFQDSTTQNNNKVFAGINSQGLPSLIGLYCAYQSNITQSAIDKLISYADFFATLNLGCNPTFDRTQGATYFTFTPDANTPSTIYYQSYTKANMGGRMLVTDTATRISP